MPVAAVVVGRVIALPKEQVERAAQPAAAGPRDAWEREGTSSPRLASAGPNTLVRELRRVAGPVMKPVVQEREIRGTAAGRGPARRVPVGPREEVAGPAEGKVHARPNRRPVR